MKITKRQLTIPEKSYNKIICILKGDYHHGQRYCYDVYAYGDRGNVL